MTQYTFIDQVELRKEITKKELELKKLMVKVRNLKQTIKSLKSFATEESVNET